MVLFFTVAWTVLTISYFCFIFYFCIFFQNIFLIKSKASSATADKIAAIGKTLLFCIFLFFSPIGNTLTSETGSSFILIFLFLLVMFRPWKLKVFYPRSLLILFFKLINIFLVRPLVSLFFFFLILISFLLISYILFSTILLV